PPELEGMVVAGSLRAFTGDGKVRNLPLSQTESEAALFGAEGLLFEGHVRRRGIEENGDVNGDGDNILYLTYDVVLPPNSESGATYVITSEVVGYTAYEGGAQMTSSGLITDDVEVSVIDPAIAKSVVATSEGHTVLQGAVEQVAIGE